MTYEKAIDLLKRHLIPDLHTSMRLNLSDVKLKQIFQALKRFEGAVEVEIDDYTGQILNHLEMNETHDFYAYAIPKKNE